jgi:hypothetical protein
MEQPPLWKWLHLDVRRMTTPASTGLPRSDSFSFQTAAGESGDLLRVCLSVFRK